MTLSPEVMQELERGLAQAKKGEVIFWPVRTEYLEQLLAVARAVQPPRLEGPLRKRLSDRPCNMCGEVVRNEDLGAKAHNCKAKWEGQGERKPAGSDICECGDFRSQHDDSGCRVCKEMSGDYNGCTHFRFAHVAREVDLRVWNRFIKPNSKEETL